MEVWKDIEGYGGLYQVSNFGRIKSCLKNRHGGRFNCDRWFREKILDQQIVRGYCHVCLYSKGIPKQYMAHRLVAMSFVKNPKNKPQINHKNGIKTDNVPDNLEWCTQKENNIHACVTGLRIGVRGEKHHNAKLTQEQVLAIRKEYCDGSIFHKDLATKYGVDRKTIGNIINKINWAYV